MHLYCVAFTLSTPAARDLCGSLTVYAANEDDAARVAWAELQRLVTRWADAVVIVEGVEPEGV